MWQGCDSVLYSGILVNDSWNTAMVQSTVTVLVKYLPFPLEGNTESPGTGKLSLGQ